MPPKCKSQAEQVPPRNAGAPPVVSRKARSDIHEEENQKASLMTLPAELRIAIYEYALVGADVVTVTATLKQPALLCASRQIRHEALEVWYYQTAFCFNIRDCNAELLIKFNDHLSTLDLDFDKINPWFNICNNTKKSWKSLMQWCKRICEGGCMFPGREHEPAGAYYNVVAAACEITDHYYETGANWEMCQVALDAMRFAVGAFDAAWLEDE